ncbi:MAG: DUF2292 domain-containing protein [Clostridium sp.]|nr:DUF2292 domain-containing protein [Clostridium sp.]
MDKFKEKKLTDEYLSVVQDIVKDIKYGTVTLIIQDGVVLQIDKSEKIRLK